MDQKQWFAMRATYNQELKSQKKLQSLCIESFVPMTYRVTTCKGRKIKTLVSALNNYVFVYGTAQEIYEAKKEIPYIRYVMDHGKNKIIVPNDQMENFKRVSSVNDNSAIYFLPNEINIKKDTRIRIHGGVFDGVEGSYIKLEGKRNKRLLVMLDDIIAVTVIVDPELIEVLE